MKWGLTRETQRGKETWTIKRWNPDKGCPERLPVSEYRHIRENEAELQALVKRLNAPLSAKSKVEFKHAFIDEALIAEYLEYRLTEVHNQSVAVTKVGYLRRYALNYFIGELDVMDPANWHQYRREWGEFLIKSKTARSARTKKDIIYEVNKFLDWLAEKRNLPTLYRHVEPLSKSQLQSVEKSRRAAGEQKKRRPVEDAHWDLIVASLPEQIAGPVFLGYFYGLRRGESLAVKPDNVTDTHLFIERQMSARNKYGLPKGGKTRKVPHWFAEPFQTEYAVELAISYDITPTKLHKLWKALMGSLKLDYDFHDLRHTFINKAMHKAKRPKVVQKAAGHASLVTTDGYTHDSDDLDEAA